MRLGIYHLGVILPEPIMAVVQRVAEEARALGEHPVDTAMRDICASKGAVPVHTDANPPGHVIMGAVWRSDGHRLFRGLDDTEGHELLAGDFYALDPDVPHWTECPDPEGWLIFTPHIMKPDGRTARKLANDIRWGIVSEIVTASRGVDRGRKVQRVAKRRA